MTPYHVNRSKIFVRERFGDVEFVDTDLVEALIEQTRFPGSNHKVKREHAELSNLVRSADLIGQMGDSGYLRKCAALFREFEEIGSHKPLGYTSHQDLRSGYPKFFWNMIQPDVVQAIKYLNVTQAGKSWVNNLYANVFIEEHGA
jgi:hypothetical protein